MFISNPTESRINDLLRRARNEKWHEGIRHVRYDYYKREVARLAGKDEIKRNEAIGELRVIFGYTVASGEGYQNV